MKPIEKTYSPTVFLVDDDLPSRVIIRKKFHNETSIGVLVSGNLSEARKIIDDKQIEFDAIIADIIFAPGLDDLKHGLHDGIDLLKYCKKKRPSLSEYVISMYAGIDSYKKRSKQLGLKIEDWFEKLSFGSPQGVTSPWSKIERDLIKKALLSDKTYEERASQLGIGQDKEANLEMLSERARCTLMPTIKTYIQELDDNFTVNHPIEVFCRYIKKNHVVVSANKLGLLQEGIGETVEEALINLKEIIMDNKIYFDSEDNKKIIGYAAHAKDRLDFYVKLNLK